MAASFSLYVLTVAHITHYYHCNAFKSEYYPVFGTETSFQLNLDDEVTYGSSAPSVTALEENIFAVAWAGTSTTRNIDYNENIYCRLFYMRETTDEPQLLLPTITINTFTNKSHHSPQISALSDHNNQISDSKRFAIVWHSDDLNGHFDGIYTKIIRWDYEEENRNEISVLVLSDDVRQTELKVNEASYSLIGEVDISPIFDIGRFAITWLAWTRKGHIETYDVYCKVYDNYGSTYSNQFMVDMPSSKKQSEPSITPIDISYAPPSTYLIATWSVYDDVSDVTAIYAKLINVGSDLASLPQYVINETVMDGGIDVFAWDPSNGAYPKSYHNEAPDTSYLMKDYMIAVWSSTTDSSRQYEIHCAVYYVDIAAHAFVNVYDVYTMDKAVHEVKEGVHYRNPKIETMTCYQSDLDYTDFKNIDGATEVDRCDVSICYQYEDSNALSQTYCSFWSVYKGTDVRNITMQKYYENDVQMTDNQRNVWYPASASWNRFYEDISSPVNGKLLVVEQRVDDGRGYGIYGRVIQYANWSMEHPPNANRSTQSKSVLIIVLVVVFLIFLVGVVYACYYKKCVDGQSLIKKDIVAVNKKAIVNRLSKYKNKWSGSNKKRRHHEVSGIDTDEEDSDTIDLGNDDDTMVAENNRKKIRNKQKYQISGDSDTDSSDSEDESIEIGGGDRNMNLQNDSSSEEQQNNDANVKDKRVEEDNEEEIEHSRVMLLKHEQYDDVLQANLSSDDSSGDLNNNIKL
eukprot:31990_1